MRAQEFISEEQKLDEILPLIGAAAGAVARGVGAVAGRAAMGLGKAALRGAGNLAKGAATSLVKGIVPGGDDDEETDDNPNKTVGVQPNAAPATATPKTTPQTANVTKTMTDKAAKTIANLKPGTNIQMPTNTGRVGNFKVTKTTPNDVEIENPDKVKNPTEPDRVVFNKKDLARAMGVQ
jgi:hypothetical protein